MNNKFGIDEKSYNLIIDFFKKHSQIKIAKIFGCSDRLRNNKNIKNINLIIFGIYNHIEFLELKETLCSLKQPYNINLFNSFSYYWYDENNYIETQWNKSPIIYKSEDYKDYEKEFKIPIKSNHFKAWEIVFIELLKRTCCLECNLLEREFYENFYSDKKTLKYDLYKTLKECYVYFIYVLDEYFQNNTQKDSILPKTLLKLAYENGLINNLNNWYSIINTLIDYRYNCDSIDIEKYEKDFYKFAFDVENLYLPEIKNACNLLKLKSKHKFDYINVENYKSNIIQKPTNEFFGLNKEAYEMIINFFKQRPAIKYVRVYGSRSKGGRVSSDLDLFIEGTMEPYMVSAYCSAINQIRQPYFIDFSNVKKSLITRNHRNSFYLYKRKDYFSDNYIENGPLVPSFDIKLDKRWLYRYTNVFYPNYICFTNILKYFYLQPYFTKMKLIEDFKQFFDGTWKLLKDYLKEEKNMNVLMPRKIFKTAYNVEIIDNLSVWYEMIFDWHILTNENFKENNDEMFYRIKNKYIPEFAKINNYFRDRAEEYKEQLQCSLIY